MELRKLPNRSLGFSVAGGKGSTPAYEDVDEVSWTSSMYCVNIFSVLLVCLFTGNIEHLHY